MSIQRERAAAREHELTSRLFGTKEAYEAETPDTNLQGLDDNMLFALDTHVAPDERAPSAPSERPALWHDEDDERITVALAGASARAADGSMRGTKRLRKLRTDPNETTVTGVEYQRRLRRHDSAWSAPLLQNLLSSDAGLLSQQQRSSLLSPTKLEVERLRDANEAQGRVADPAAIEQLQFHPSGRAHVLLTASRDRRVRLFQINGTNNPLLETLHVPDLPIKTAQFHPSGSSVLIAGPRPYLYAYDIRSGKTLCSSPWRGAGRIVSSAAGTEADAGAERDLSFIRFQPGSASRLVAVGGRRGQVHLLDWGAGAAGQTGGQRIGELRMNAPLAGMAWAQVPGEDSEHRLLTLSTEGRVHIWDMRSRSCPVTAYDTGLFGAKGLEVTPHLSAVPSMWAIGSNSGLLNVYGGEGDSATSSSLLEDLLATPATAAVTDDVSLKARNSLGNLTTAITSLHFSHDAQLLAMASRHKKDALRIVHSASLQTFANWPTAGTPLGHVSSLGFSAHSEYLAIGNTRGRVLLYSMRSYL
ncbi:U3 snoRNP protein [Malassezia equina]|uniref:U3 snoRNP protein n=1 Tax=Malassezia equina TaxID=1381935 RepID=A0AAF0EF32_9BASI|nr:U3 snoRNP protein [Malassezia equina]